MPATSNYQQPKQENRKKYTGNLQHANCNIITSANKIMLNLTRTLVKRIHKFIKKDSQGKRSSLTVPSYKQCTGDRIHKAKAKERTIWYV